MNVRDSFRCLLTTKTSYLTLSSTLILLLAASLISGSAAATEADQYEEVTYENLVQRISEKKNQITRSSNPSSSLETLMIHAGFGLISSVNSVNIDNRETLKSQNGFQLSLGIDLFSENFIAEGALRNFGQSTSGSETRSLREFDLKLTYQDKFANKSGFHIGSGLGTRIFKLSDPASNRNINDTTPSILLVGGLDAFVSKNFSLGFELGWRTALVTSTIDKNSMDGTLRLDTFF
jgi:hypothetical protein